MKALESSWIVIGFCLIATVALAAEPVEPTFRDVEYATVESKPLKLDLYLPTGQAERPVIVWVHGAAHGGPLFNGDSGMKPVEQFLEKYLLSK